MYLRRVCCEEDASKPRSVLFVLMTPGRTVKPTLVVLTEYSVACHLAPYVLYRGTCLDATLLRIMYHGLNLPVLVADIHEVF